MTFTRRSFIQSVFAAVAAGVVFDKDRALWLPGEKAISIPASIDLVPVNLSYSRQIGLFHDGLHSRFDVISTVPLSSLPAPVREHWEHLNGWRIRQAGRGSVVRVA